MANILEIQRAIKRIIEKFIANQIEVTSDIFAGDETIHVSNNRRLQRGDEIVVYNRDNPNSAEAFCVSELPNRTSIVISQPTLQHYSSNKTVLQKLVGYQGLNHTEDPEFLHGIYIGEPTVIPMFPAITIDAKSRNTEWMTLESVKHDFTIDITVYVSGLAHHESQMELLYYYTDAIEKSLFRSFYPLVKPYALTTLAEDANAEDTLIKVSNPEFFRCGMGWIFFESATDLLSNRIIESLGGGVLRLVQNVGRDFFAGDNVIHPYIHVFNTMPASTQYGTINKGSPAKAGVISYKCSIEEKINNNYVDPLTF